MHPTNQWRKAIVVVASIAFGAARILGLKAIWFQAIAHCWVGGLVGYRVAKPSRLALWLAIGLSALELFAALVLKP